MNANQWLKFASHSLKTSLRSHSIQKNSCAYGWHLFPIDTSYISSSAVKGLKKHGWFGFSRIFCCQRKEAWILAGIKGNHPLREAKHQVCIDNYPLIAKLSCRNYSFSYFAGLQAFWGESWQKQQITILRVTFFGDSVHKRVSSSTARSPVQSAETEEQ